MSKIPFVLLVGSALLLAGCGASGAPQAPTNSPATNITSDAPSSTPSPSPVSMPGSDPTESGCAQEGHISSPSSFDKASVTFDNQTAGDLKVYWIDFQGKRKFYSNLKAHSTLDQATWIGHVWVVADAADQCIKLESANAVQQTLVIK